MKIFSWNVEHFTGKAGGPREGRLKRVIDSVQRVDPDIFALIEVESSHVFSSMVGAFPGYTFSITEGRQTQEILIGVRNNISAFFTQKSEFKRSQPGLRPGALLTITNKDDTPLPILFVHLKSISDPEGFGLRDAMFQKVRELKKKIDEKFGHSSEFILIGDLNTMGMNLTYSEKDISSTEEIRRVEKVLGYCGLRKLPKTHQFTYSEGSLSQSAPLDIDHVFATDGLAFRDQGDGAKVLVGGWALKRTNTQRDKWIAQFSDHAPLIFEIHGR